MNTLKQIGIGIALAALILGAAKAGVMYGKAHAEHPPLEAVWDGPGYPVTCFDQHTGKASDVDSAGQCAAPFKLYAYVRSTRKLHMVQP